MKLICAQIDLARQKENAEYIRKYIDFAAKNGYNAMLCYLENAVRTDETQYFDHDDTYSPEEIREIVSYGDEKGVSLIPAFENLGHLEKFFAYPELEKLSECENEREEGRGFCSTPRGTCGCTSGERLYAFFEKYIAEVSSAFTSPYIHMGLDEPFDFAVCPRCKKRVENGESKAQMFLKHVMRSYELVKKLGKTMLMWDDFFEYADVVRELPRDIILCNWNYYFVGDLPAGHWTGRVKKDWFYLYERLGFKYIFCAYMGEYSSAYNVRTLTRYAMKYHPYGAIATSWEKSGSFYLSTYPILAAAGRLWSGRIRDSEFLNVYSEITGSKKTAEALLSVQAPMYFTAYIDTAMSECDYFVKSAFRENLASATARLRAAARGNETNEKADIRKDISRSFMELYARTLTEKATDELFEVYETGKTSERGKLALARGKKLLDCAESLYRESEIIAEYLLGKYRKNIISRGFINKYENLYERIKEIRLAFDKAEQSAVLYGDFMMHDGFGTPNAKILAGYEDGTEKLVYSGGIKPSYTSFECGGVYTFKFLLSGGKSEQKIKYIIFSSAGEGQTFPVNFRYAADGKEYVAAHIEKTVGEMYFENNVIYPDTRFAILGNGDGEAHFNDIGLGKRENGLKITFKELQ
jgi:glycoside hydrolase family 20